MRTGFLAAATVGWLALGLAGSAWGQVPISGGIYSISDDLLGGVAGHIGIGASVGGVPTSVAGTLGQLAINEASGIAAELPGPPSHTLEPGFYTKVPRAPANPVWEDVAVSSFVYAFATAPTDPSGTKYRVQVSTAQNFTGELLDIFPSDSPRLVENLEQDTAYYVRVRAEYMQGEVSAFTAVLSTRTAIDPIVALAVSNPAFPKAGEYVNVPPNFVWKGPSASIIERMGPGSRFHLEVANEPNFTNPFIRISTPAAVLGQGQETADGAYVSTYTLINNTVYYWRVRASNRFGVFSPYSTPVQSFVTDFVSPSTVTPNFQSLNSAGEVKLEAEVNNLTVGPTVQITVQDIHSGLSANAAAYGVLYSNDGGQTWTDFAGPASETPFQGNSEVFALAAFNGTLLAGMYGSSPLSATADGNTWTPVTLVEGVTAVHSFAAFKEKLYAGTSPSGMLLETSSLDGLTGWAPVPLQTGQSHVLSLAVFNGRLYAGTAPNGQVHSTSDGQTWTPVFDAGQVQVNALAVFNGRLYAGTAPNGIVYATSDGIVWRDVLGGTGGSYVVAPGALTPSDVGSTGETQVLSLAVFNGRLYAGTLPGGKIFATSDGENWGPPVFTVPGTVERHVQSLFPYRGKLYAGVNPGSELYASPNGTDFFKVAGPLGSGGVRGLASFLGKLYAGADSPTFSAPIVTLTPVPAELSGADGAKTPQTLKAPDVALAASDSTAACSGVHPCAAKNQVWFTLTDKAGNAHSAGPFSVTVDNLVPTLGEVSADPVWRRQNDGSYTTPLDDVGVAGLDKFQIQAFYDDGAGSRRALTPAFADVLGGLPTPYQAGWKFKDAVFDALEEGSYNRISLKVFDKAGNSSIFPDAFTVLKDTTAPKILLTLANTAGNSYGPLAASTGPTQAYDVDFEDTPSQLVALEYSTSTTPASMDASTPTWRPIVTLPSPAPSYTDDWRLDFDGLEDQAINYVSVRSWDLAGSTRTAKDAFRVLKDVSGPKVGISTPSEAFRSSLPAVSGTSFDFAGVREMKLSIRRLSDNMYFDASATPPDFSSLIEVFNLATGTNPWTFESGQGFWEDNKRYRLRARGLDVTDTLSPILAEWTFGYDNTKPLAALVLPAVNGTVTTGGSSDIVGTAYDPGSGNSGLDKVDVSFQRKSDDKWWDFGAAAWAASSAPPQPSASVPAAASWTLTPPDLLKANLQHNTSYFVTARARDKAIPSNNGSFFVAETTFTFLDVSSPSAVNNLEASTGATVGEVRLTWDATGDDETLGTMLTCDFLVQYATAVIAWDAAKAQVFPSTSAVAPRSRQTLLVGGLDVETTYYFNLWTRDDAGNLSPPSNNPKGSPLRAIAISGRVLQSDGKGLSAIILEAYDANGALVGESRTVGDGTGMFEIQGLPKGTYRVQATWTAEDLSSSVSKSNIPENASRLDFTLALSYVLSSISGTVTVNPAGVAGLHARRLTGVRRQAAAETGAYVELFAKGRFVAAAPVRKDGRFRISNLLPGSYELRAFDGANWTEKRAVRLEQGQDAALAFTGTLLDEDSVFAFPNPAKDSVTIRFLSDAAALEATVTIYDVVGAVVRTIETTEVAAAGPGLYHAAWDTRNDAGRRVASGVYLFVVKVKDALSGERRQAVKKLAIIR